MKPPGLQDKANGKLIHGKMKDLEITMLTIRETSLKKLLIKFTKNMKQYA